MKTIEIVMRIVCFLLGVMLAFGVNVHITNGSACEVLANTLFMFVWLSAVLTLVILPWALPRRK